VLDKHAEFPLAWGSGVDSLPVVSFAEGTVAYLENTAESPIPRLWLMNTTGGNKRRIPVRKLDDPVFTPDSRWLYAGASAGADTVLNLSRLAHDGSAFLPVVTWKGSSGRWPAFSADGKFMAFVSNAEGLWQVYLTNQTGEAPLRITDAKANHASPLFSPDGNYIVCLTDRTAFNGGSDIWVYDRVKGTERQLTDNAHVRDYAWLSDSRTIVYSTGINVLDLNALDIASGMSRKLIAGHGPRDYSEITPQVVNHRGVDIIIYVREYLDGKRRIYSVNPDGGEDRQIVTDQGNSWLK
jgi:Tol biopolymer transport system component